MLEHMKTRRTDGSFYSKKTDCPKKESDKPMSLDEFIEKHFKSLPHWAIALKGLRRREGLSQSSDQCG